MRRIDSINYPQTAPQQTGVLGRGRHRVRWSSAGNPEGIPVIVSHGGPGGQNRAFYRTLFDPAKWRIVQIDQRGNGLSEPAGELRENTTQHLLRDMEDLRAELCISRWLVAGGSWGSTLSLAYAETHPERALGLFLFCLWPGTPDIFDFWWQAGRWTFPECYAELIRDFDEHELSDIQGALFGRILGEDPDRAADASSRLLHFEEILMHLNAPISEEKDYKPEVYSRIFAHYMTNGCFLEPDQLATGAQRLASMPVKIIHGRYDMCTPPKYAFDFKAVIPHADLRIVDNASHMPLERDLLREIVRAGDDFFRELQAMSRPE